jgi:signal transduction histidine kinase
VENAIKFCDKPVVELGIGYQSNPEGHHELFVKDNGPGIPGEEFERVFEEFYQIDKFFTGSVAGVGLGLALARRLIEKAGGRIWVTSDLGKGSTFHFTLPVVGNVLRDAA